ncbi:MAG: SusC/RagA family TonB-linked outer membrane protein [Myxococcaceae bacterium]|nr:SusC/RagA family TonB-linked outer membrane protein [Myxococcaceae bacterium]
MAAPVAQTRTLKGRVVDGKNGEGVPLATVTVDATPPIQVEADVDGNFVVEGVPMGGFKVRGFSADFLPLDTRVAAGQSEVTLKLARAFEEEVVVVGRATAVSRVNAPSAVAQVKAADLVAAPVQTVDAALAGKVAGANIQSNSGAPGGGMQLKLRGVSTINGSTAPLYVVDGVIVSDMSIPNGLNAVTASAGGSSASNQDDPVNRIADLNPNDIEDIQILRGASAAAIYGSKASNGVVIITTKKGKAGTTQPQVSFTQRVGTYQLARTMGSRAWTREDATTTFGQDAVDAYFQDGRRFNIEELLASNNAPSFETNLSANGSMNDGKTTYFASANVSNNEGIVTGTGYDKQGVRLNLGQKFGELLDIDLTTNLIHSNAARGMFGNDNAGVSPYVVLSGTPSFWDPRPDAQGNYPANPFLPSATNPLQTVSLMQNDEDVWRFLGSANATLKLVNTNGHDVRLLGNLGADRFHQKNILLFPPELHFEPLDDGLAGTSLLTNSDNVNFNTGLNLVHSWDVNSAVVDNATTSVGFQYEERQRDSTLVVSENMIAGQQNVDSGTKVSLDQFRQIVRDRGAYIQEELLLFNRRLMLNAAIRGDQSSLNGDTRAIFYYPKAGVAYRVPGLPGWMNELKVRASYGETGNAPNWGYRYTPLLATSTINGLPGIINSDTAGNANIRPERQREIEAGIDLIGFNGDGVLELTVYQRTISDMLLTRAVAQSGGSSNEYINGGEMWNRGVELMLQATPVKSDIVKWDSRTTFALNRSMVTDLPDGVPPFYIPVGFGVNLGGWRIKEGGSPTAIYSNVGFEADGKTKIVEQIGDVEPAFRMGFGNTFTFGGLRVHTLFDWLQGSHTINLARLLYDFGGNTSDYVAGRNDTYRGDGADRVSTWTSDFRPYVEDASFLKLREVTISYDLPTQWYQQLVPGIRSARLSLSGRNLLTFSKYSGLDPEVSNFGNQAIGRNIDVGPYPPSRSFWGSIELGF